MRRRFSLIILTLMLSVILSGCNGKGNVTLPNNTTPTVSDNSANNNESNNEEKRLPPSDDNNIGEENTNDKPDEPQADKTSIKNIKCRIYLFNRAELKHYYVDKTLPVESGALVAALTNELQSTSYGKDFLPLTDKVKVKSVDIDKSTGILKIVFNDSYVDKMNLGSNTESGLLTSLIATYGYNLKAEKVAIYFNDKLYTSLGELKEGYFKVEYPSAEQYNH